MTLKTDSYYNEDDFAQEGENLKELTVTITLCEYRNLLKDIAYQDKTIEKLEDENKKLTEQNKNLITLIASQNPEMIRKLVEAITGVFVKDNEQSDTDSTEEADNEQRETD